MSDIRALDPADHVQQLATFLAWVLRELPTAEALHATLTADAQLRRLTAITGDSDALIGYCNITRLASASADQVTLWIATHPHYRQRGIATALYRDTCRFLRTHQLCICGSCSASKSTTFPQYAFLGK